jgi:polyisoprenoid-binding protein YceI
METITTKIKLIGLISIITLSAISLNQKAGSISGNSGSDNGDIFPVIAQEFNINVSEANDGFREISVIIPIDEITTDNWMRDVHLRMSIFDSKYKNIEFTSKTNIPLESGIYDLAGNLNINGKSNPSTLQIEIYNKGDKIFVKGSSTVSLKAYEIAAPGMGSMKVKDEISINFDLEL